jgi:hypothetical protein
VHWFGDLKNVAKSKGKSGDGAVFAKRVKRLLRDAMRLCGQRSTLEITKYERLADTSNNA